MERIEGKKGTGVTPVVIAALYNIYSPTQRAGSLAHVCHYIKRKNLRAYPQSGMKDPEVFISIYGSLISNQFTSTVIGNTLREEILNPTRPLLNPYFVSLTVLIFSPLMYMVISSPSHTS